MTAELTLDPADDPSYRAALRAAKRQGISLVVEHRAKQWTVLATHTDSGAATDATGIQLAVAAWQALEQLRPTIAAAEAERQRLAPPVSRPRPARVVVPFAIIDEAYELLAACAAGVEGDPPDRERTVAVMTALKSILIRAIGARNA